jgi:Uma2 family endonuclease
MATDTAARPITAEEFLEIEAAAGEDAHLELINGEIRQYPDHMTSRSPRHSSAIARCSQMLANWLDTQLDRAGDVAAGEARCRLSRDPDNIVGIDVAYFEDTPVVEVQGSEKYYDGAPVIAVEVLSGSDTHENVIARIRTFLEAGVRQVWVADPDLQTITVHRTEAQPKLYAAGAVLDADPDLPGFSCPVEQFFGRARRQ